MVKTAIAALALFACFNNVRAFAQEYPTKPITLVCPWGPGGSAGHTALLVSDRLARLVGQPVVVDYRAGASGAIGSQYVAHAKPDGYTLLLSGFSSHVVGALSNQANFDPVNDFTHIAYLAGVPWFVVVNNSVGANNLREFVAYSKTLPKGISVASPGIGSLGHLVIESIRVQAGANVVHVPYKSSAPAVIDIMSNQIPAGTMTVTSADKQIKAGKLRPLVITAMRRISAFPEVQTVAEAGFPKLSGTAWHAISGPPGMSASIVARLNTEIRALLKEPQVLASFASESMETEDMKLEAVTAFFRADIERWRPVARQFDLQ